MGVVPPATDALTTPVTGTTAVAPPPANVMFPEYGLLALVSPATNETVKVVLANVEPENGTEVGETTNAVEDETAVMVPEAVFRFEPLTDTVAEAGPLLSV